MHKIQDEFIAMNALLDRTFILKNNTPYDFDTKALTSEKALVKIQQLFKYE